MRVDGAHFELAYSGDCAPLGYCTFGADLGRQPASTSPAPIVHAASGPDGPGWYFEMKSTDGWLAAEPPHTQRLPIELVSARGLLAPEQGRIVLSQFALRAGGAEVTAQGDVANVGGTAKGQLEAKIGPMSAAVFKTLWPGWVAPHARTWVVQRLARGNMLGGAFKLVRGVGPPGSDWAPMGSGDRVSFTLEGANLELHLVKGWPALEMPRGLLRVENRSVEFTAPEGSMTASDGRKLALKGTFSVDLDEPVAATRAVSPSGARGR